MGKSTVFPHLHLYILNIPTKSQNSNSRLWLPNCRIQPYKVETTFSIDIFLRSKPHSIPRLFSIILSCLHQFITKWQSAFRMSSSLLRRTPGLLTTGCPKLSSYLMPAQLLPERCRDWQPWTRAFPQCISSLYHSLRCFGIFRCQVSAAWIVSSDLMRNSQTTVARDNRMNPAHSTISETYHDYFFPCSTLLISSCDASLSA